MNVPRLLTVRLAPQFTMELDALRRDGWEVCPADSARDEFDDQSVHVIVSDGDQPVGMVRVTLDGRSVLGTWSRGRVPLPHGPDVAELTRAVVAEPVRRLGIYRLAMLETVLSLRALGARLATAAIEPDFPGRRFLLRLGFLAVGAPVVFDDLPRSRTLAQPIVLTLDARGECRVGSNAPRPAPAPPRRRVRRRVGAACVPALQPRTSVVGLVGADPDAGASQGDDLLEAACRRRLTGPACSPTLEGPHRSAGRHEGHAVLAVG